MYFKTQYKKHTKKYNLTNWIKMESIPYLSSFFKF